MSLCNPPTLDICDAGWYAHATTKAFALLSYFHQGARAVACLAGGEGHRG